MFSSGCCFALIRVLAASGCFLLSGCSLYPGPLRALSFQLGAKTTKSIFHSKQLLKDHLSPNVGGIFAAFLLVPLSMTISYSCASDLSKMHLHKVEICPIRCCILSTQSGCAFHSILSITLDVGKVYTSLQDRLVPMNFTDLGNY